MTIEVYPFLKNWNLITKNKKNTVNVLKTYTSQRTIKNTSF